MRKLFLVVFALTIIVTNVYADESITFFGYYSKMGNMSPQSFNETGEMILEDDGAVSFKGNSYEYDYDITPDITVYTSPYNNSLSLVIDSSDPTGNDILFVTLVVDTGYGSASYVYADTYLQFSPDYYYTYSGFISDNQGPNYGYDNGNAGNNSSSSSNYQSMYDRWERNAQNAYNSLDGHSGSANTYVQNKKLLREAQREMRSIRQKASREGITIAKSRWESVTVNVN